MAAERFVLRATLEAASPLMIASGDEDALNDNMIVRDPNGLPMIPATSLAGALRSAVRDKAKANSWFGWAEGDDGNRSPVTLTDALFHWADDRPRDGLLTAPIDLDKMRIDPLCKHVLPEAPPLTRQHVRLNDRGVVDGSGKFTRTAVPAGARFTFELQTDNKEAAAGVAALIKVGLWLGGATRSGYGQMRCVAFGRKNLSLPRDWTDLCKLAAKDLGSDGLLVRAPYKANTTPARWGLSGRIEGPLLVGAGARSLAEGGSLAEDRAPWREKRFKWTASVAGTGSVQKNVWVVPGSAIKGPLRHRALFHLRKAKVPDAEKVIDTVFGSVADGAGGAAGKLRFLDIVIPDAEIIVQTHVGLDRFTGGARRSVLFTDALLWRPELSVKIAETQDLKPVEHAALAAALQDMCDGLCGIGAEWGEGAGIFGTGARPTVPAMPVKAVTDAG
ncbi:MAG: RAMP superfamily CRISPR-associated protein [Gemmobacter sp.]